MIRAIRVWSCSLLWVLVVFVTHTTSEAIATWEQKDPFSAPTPRAFHTMAWSSAAGGLYVFGGVDGSSDLNDLHLYVHEANQWQKINASGDAPSPRYRHTMAWSSAAGGLYVFGGLDSSYGYLNDLYLYVHEANQWQKINASGDAPSPRYRHTMAWSSAAGGLYVFGGSDSSYNYLNDLYLYVHEANQWQKINATGDAPSPRKGHAMAWSSTVGGLYVFGGLDSSYDYQNDLYLYVHEANQWQKINASGDVPSPLYGHTMAWSSAAGGLYVFGRLDSGGYLKDPNDLHLYVHEENEWRRPTFCNCAKPSAAYGHAMAWSSAAGGLYVFGGLGSGEYLSELHLYVHEDPQGWQRKVPFSTPSPRDQPTMAWSSAAGGLYMLGGINSRVQLNEPNDLYLYVPEANQWQKINATGDAPSPCYGHTMGWSSDAGLYVFGGRQLFVDGSGDHNDLHLYVHEANHWQKINATGDVPSPRYGHTMAWSSAAGGLYVFGGLSGGYLNDLYLYVHEANQWQKINALGDVPTPRFRHTMVWSGAEAGGLYLFGGWNLREDYLNDLYLYIHEANQWHEIHAGGDIPSPREGHTMAWSSAAGGLYVFGGSGRGYRYLNDLYLYVVEATQWHHIPNNWQAPSPRSGHTMAWSSAAGGLYVFGGSDDIGGGAAYNDLFFLPEVNVTVAVAPVDVGQKDIIVAAVAISSGSAFFLLLTFCAFYKRQLRLKEAASKLKKDLELNNPLAIKNFFLYSDACLVRFECLKEIYQKGQAWPRRQEADGMTVGGATALVTRKELEDVMYDEDSRKFYLPSEDDESSKLTEVHFCSVSHSWEAMEHPDPWRDQLRETINRLDHLRSHVWIFYDYASLYQFPRKTNKQMQSFNRALSHMHLLYAHDWVNVEIISKLTDQAVKEKMERDNSYIEVYNVKIGAVGPVPIAELTFNDVPYLERGWCIAEMQWASTREGEDHAVPEPPEQFAKRLCQLKFTHRSDASAVQELQEKVFREKTGRTTKLRFDKLPPEQVHILCSALQHYPKLEMITISRTKLQPTGVAAVLRCRAVLAVLVNCDLRDEEAAAMQDILENETTAVKQLEVGRNDNMSLNASKSLTLAALKKNVKLLLETEAQDRELGRKIGKSIESIQDLITVRIDGQSADEARDILASTLSQEVPDRSQRQQCEKAGTTP